MGGHTGFDAACCFVLWAAFVAWPFGQFGGHSLGHMAGHAACHLGYFCPATLGAGDLGASSSDGLVDLDGEFA